MLGMRVGDDDCSGDNGGGGVRLPSSTNSQGQIRPRKRRRSWKPTTKAVLVVKVRKACRNRVVNRDVAVMMMMMLMMS